MAAKVMMAVSSLLVNVLLARVLTPVEMGTYFLIASMVGIATTISMFGLGLSVVNKIPNLLGKEQVDEAKNYAIKALLYGLLGASVVALFILLPSGGWLAEYVIHSHALLAVLGLFATQVFFQSLLSLTAEIFRSFHEIRFASLFTGASVMVMFAASIVLIVLLDIRVDLAVILKINLFWIGVSLVCGLWLLRPYVKHGTNKYASNVIKSAAPLFVISMSWLAYRLDMVFLQSHQGAEDVAIYGAASKLVLLMSMPLELVNAFVTPIIGELWAKGETKRLEKMLQGITALVSIPAILLIGAFMFFPSGILRSVYGDYYASGATILIILSLGQLVNALTGSVAWTLLMTQNEHSLLKVNLAFGVLLALSSLWAVHFYGTVGLAIAVTLVYALHNISLVIVLKFKTGLMLIPDPRSIKFCLGESGLIERPQKNQWMKPNFFIIGAPKCGTTSLATYLDRNPYICMSNPKEPHYFSRDIWHQGFSFEDYKRCFLGAGEQHLAIGEASVFYLYSSEAIKEILKFNPLAKFIVMIRNPIDFVESLHEQLYVNGDEDIEDFSMAWGQQKSRENGQYLPRFCHDTQVLQYRKMGLLSIHLEKLFEKVGRERVHVIVLDDLKENPRKVYESVLRFLGVPDDNQREFSVINGAKKIRSPVLLKTFRTLIQIKTYLRLPGLGLGIYNKLGAVNIVSGIKRKPMSNDMRNMLRSVFSEEVEKLSILLGRNLMHWLHSQEGKAK